MAVAEAGKGQLLFREDSEADLMPLARLWLPADQLQHPVVGDIFDNTQLRVRV
jgi:hypothetical protein